MKTSVKVVAKLIFIERGFVHFRWSTLDYLFNGICCNSSFCNNGELLGFSWVLEPNVGYEMP